VDSVFAVVYLFSKVNGRIPMRTVNSRFWLTYPIPTPEVGVREGTKVMFALEVKILYDL
jgi:hypothetical protein